MARVAEKTNPKLWDKVKDEVTRSSKGGKAGQWSARKAQIAVQRYKQKGGGFRGRKSNENSLEQWQDEDWGTKSGQKSQETGERYLPKKARDALTDKEYKRTSDKKRRDSRKGKQFSGQPRDIAAKTAKYRHDASAGSSAPTKAELYEIARKRDLPGRSRMTKAELQNALHETYTRFQA